MGGKGGGSGCVSIGAFRTTPIAVFILSVSNIHNDELGTSYPERHYDPVESVFSWDVGMRKAQCQGRKGLVPSSRYEATISASKLAKGNETR